MGTYFALWLVMVFATVTLVIYRLLVCRGDYTILHVRKSEFSLIPKQLVETHRQELIGRWSKILIAVTLGYGVVLLSWLLYSGFLNLGR